ncbi:hypothetical protein [Aureimonas jatrophae]|uniref:hypothetical protein n=1 Tax=Aureimonas jatrophae TaxID=1166073 RepID=UPI000B87F7F2|nr:hypothetical protein [Aureimonas jatrophae]MBB3951026.1 hypothetical protein [Aureimonas jatrophae]
MNNITTEEVIDSRAANALFADARMSQMAERGISFGGVDPKIVASALDRFSSTQGGLWVGGRAVVTRSAFVFKANRVNRLAHVDGDQLRFEIPLREITSVTYRFGWLSGIVDIGSDRGVFLIRSFRAKAFAQMINTASANSRDAR